MAEEELSVNGIKSPRGGKQKSSNKKAKRRESIRERGLLDKSLDAVEEAEEEIKKKGTIEGQDTDIIVEMRENKGDSGSGKKHKNKRKKHVLIEKDDVEEELEVDTEGVPGEMKLSSNNRISECGESKRKKQLLNQAAICEGGRISGANPLPEGNLKLNDGNAKGQRDKGENQEVDGENLAGDRNKTSIDEGLESLKDLESCGGKTGSKKNKMKEKLLEEATKANNRGVCYLSRIPPHMDHVKLRQILSQFGEIQRIYLAPEDPSSQVHRKRAGGFRGQVFSEGWVEFTKKSIAKRVANMLNGEQIGGRKRSAFYYDLWNIKYLSKFKWDDLTEEIAYKNAVREQKLPLVLSAAKREKDFYLSKVEKSRALSAIEERMKKKQKSQQETGTDNEPPVGQPKVIRQFPQTKPVKKEDPSQGKPRLSRDILAGIFGGS